MWSTYNPWGDAGYIQFKGGKIEAPEFYLGAKLQKKLINGIQCWTITSQDLGCGQEPWRSNQEIWLEVADIGYRHTYVHHFLTRDGRDGRNKRRGCGVLPRVNWRVAMSHWDCWSWNIAWGFTIVAISGESGRRSFRTKVAHFHIFKEASKAYALYVSGVAMHQLWRLPFRCTNKADFA